MLRIRKTAQDLVAFAENGDLATSGFYLESSSNAVQSGELSIRRGALVNATSRPSGARRDFALRARLFETALFPGRGLQIRHAVQGIQAELDNEGDLYLCGRVTDIPPNPALPGPYGVDQVVYAAPGLNYGANPDLVQYLTFENPSPGYATRTIDLSHFGDLPTSPSWPFSATNVPINGLLRVPQGNGPFPLVLFVHGNHSPLENSTPGYVYLLDLLASHGMIAASIDCNFLNGFNFGENDGRAIVHLEHVKQFRIWNQQAGHPLQQKIDLSSVMIVGHSRGGEGVGHASAFNALASVVPDPGDPPVPLDGSLGLGPYGFALKAVVAIAPTENQYQPVGGRVRVRDNYFIIHGSRDGDVFDFQGQLTYDRAQPIDLVDPTQQADGFKALLWVYGANHNHFNSVWSTEGSPFISRAQQELVAKVYISALAQAALFRRGQYLTLLKDSRVAHQQGWIPGAVTLVNQYQDFQRAFIAHYEEDDDPATVSPPVAGAVDTSQVAVTESHFNQGSFGNLYQQTDGARLDWASSGQRYNINIDPAGLSRGLLHLMVLRVGQSNDGKNQIGQFQDFTISLSDGTASHDVRAADFALLPYPADLTVGARRSVMQTIRVPLRVFANAGVDTDNIRQIALIFDQPISGTSTVQGSVYIDEIQLSH